MSTKPQEEISDEEYALMLEFAKANINLFSEAELSFLRRFGVEI
jgi:hypothetical protein